MTSRIVAFAVYLGLTFASSPVFAVDPPSRTIHKPRTGTTQPFGSGTITRRSDGSTGRSDPFGSGIITRERTSDGRTITGTTQRFGSGTITRWSDQTTTHTVPFGNGTLTREQGRNGKMVTGTTSPFGSGTITRRSDGSTSRTDPFGSGTITRDSPGRGNSDMVKQGRTSAGYAGKSPVGVSTIRQRREDRSRPGSRNRR